MTRHRQIFGSLAVLIAASLPGSAQQPNPSRAQTNAAAPPAALGCPSLSNLRILLRDAKDDLPAAIAVATDPKSDLNCKVIDRGAVTGISDHVALNGRAYDCVSLQTTSLCHWTLAGSVTPAKPTTEPARTGTTGAAAPKGKPR